MTKEIKKAYSTFSVSNGNSLVSKAIASQSTAIAAVKSAMYFGIGVLIQHGNGKPLTDLYSGLDKYGKKLAGEIKGFIAFMNKLEIDAGQLGKIPGNPFHSRAGMLPAQCPALSRISCGRCRITWSDQ